MFRLSAHRPNRPTTREAKSSSASRWPSRACGRRRCSDSSARGFDPFYAEAFNNLGITYEQLGRLVEARQMYERALQLDPHHPSIKQNYTLFLEIDDRRIRPLPNTAAVRHAGTADANDAPRDAGAAP
jgi:tetratricopeptide (TPR) repeat protein